jgi:transposase-like protein
MFTPEQDRELAAAYRGGRTTRDLAREYGCSDVTVLHALERVGEPRRTGGMRPAPNDLSDPVRRAEALQFYLDGGSVKRVAKRFQCRTDVVSALLAEEGVQLKPGGHRHPKFDKARSRQIADEYAAGATLQQLAERYDSNTLTIKNAVTRVGGALRHTGRPAFWTDERRAWVVEQYGTGRSQQDIADELGIHQTAVSRVLRAAGAIADPSRPAGESHGSWKGGRVKVGGYIWVLPVAEDMEFCTPNASGYVPEHRLVMGRALGRRLTRKESVHHIDGRRDHNALENLQLRQGSHGSGVVVQCLDCGSRNVEATALA